MVLGGSVLEDAEENRTVGVVLQEAASLVEDIIVRHRLIYAVPEVIQLCGDFGKEIFEELLDAEDVEILYLEYF